MFLSIVDSQEDGIAERGLQINARAAFVGVLCSRGVQWLAMTASDIYNHGIGNLIARALPNRVNAIFRRSAHILNTPLTEFAYAINAHYLHPMREAAERTGDFEGEERAIRIAQRVEFCYRAILAPLSEEVTYRGGVQILGARALEAAGLPPLAAESTAAMVGNILFGMAHLEEHQNMDSREFNTLFAAGLAMAVICSQYGLPTAIVAHAIHNISLHYLPDNTIERAAQHIRGWLPF